MRKHLEKTLLGPHLVVWLKEKHNRTFETVSDQVVKWGGRGALVDISCNRACCSKDFVPLNLVLSTN